MIYAQKTIAHLRGPLKKVFVPAVGCAGQRIFVWHWRP
jgi:hypothetical protein